MKKNITPLLFGILFIAAGVGYLGTAFWDWNLSLSFNKLWPLFIIVPALAGIVSNGPRSFSIGALIVGALFLLKSFNILKGTQFQAIMTFAIITVIGVTLIVHYFREPKPFKYSKTPQNQYQPDQSAVYTSAAEENSDQTGQSKRSNHNWHKAGSYSDVSKYPNYNAILSGVDVRNSSVELEGVRISAILGGADIDLRDAVITHDITVYATAVMGGIDIYAPKNIRINLSKTDILGGTDCTAYTMPHDTDLPVVTFCCNSILGGIDIK